MSKASISYIQSKISGIIPDTAIILGSGLGGLITALQNPVEIDYKDIPDFPQTTVAGHNGRMYIGKIGSHHVLCMQGRFHLYEGIAPQLIAEVIGILADLGVKRLIVTNAAGSLDINMPAGSIMLIKDHINMSCRNPLLGAHGEPYFPDMSNAYDFAARQQIKQLAENMKVKLYEGVYLMTLGPNYETPSEVKMFRLFGADAVGMSTVSEVLAAVHRGLKVIGFSVISNLGTGLQTEAQSHEDVLEQVGKSAAKLGELIRSYLEQE
jgi:inosine/guanosine/xanthosine phosphorylase family protein